MILSKQELQTKAMGGIGEMIPMATGMLQKMGLEPMDVVQVRRASPLNVGKYPSQTLGAGATWLALLWPERQGM